MQNMKYEKVIPKCYVRFLVHKWKVEIKYKLVYADGFVVCAPAFWEETVDFFHKYAINRGK